MTLHGSRSEVAVRELHDRLSEYLEQVENGDEVVVTRRGRPIARLTTLDGERSMEDLERRGLVRRPSRERSLRKPQVEGTGSVSDLVSEQRS
jgi:prevent-host-death family protein